MSQFIVPQARVCALTLVLGATLCACSGGGSANVRVGPPPPPPPPAYDQVYNHLIPTGAQTAQREGFTGTGVKVGILDSGADPANAALQGRITSFQSYLSGGNSSPNDVYGHGSVVAQILGGSVVTAQGFPGGVAPQASLYVGQVCDSTNYCRYAYAQQALDAQLKQGVRLFNESFGQGDITTIFPGGASDPYAQSLYADFSAPALQGALQVFSAGNDGQAQPEAPAGLPYIFPTLQPNWLAVVDIVIDSNGKPAGLYKAATDSSNACGVAAAWCLAAPGEVNYVPIAGTPFGGYGFGTSFAAAAVTGVAAQVWQAFPWMSGANVQDTVLTTATNIGPAELYGWGLVNAAKAVKGPAQFAFGSFSATVPGGVASTFANAIGGTGGLLLQGQGNLILSAQNTYSGGSTIAGGTMTVNGGVSSNVTVQAGGTLNGRGTIGASVSNAGIVQSAAASAAAGLMITGNYTAQAGSTTAVALGDPLRVGGTASLDGTLQALAPPGTYTVHGTETMLTAQTITGSFAHFTFGVGVFYTGTLGYSGNAVTATLTRANVAATASTLAGVDPMAVGTAQAMQAALTLADQWQLHATPGHAGFLAGAGEFLAAANAPAAVASLDSLSGEIHGTTRALEIQQAGLIDRALAARMHDLAQADPPGVWLQRTGASGTLAEAGYSTAHYSLGGSMLGVDAALLSNLSGGIALGRSHLDADLNRLAGRMTGREDMLAVYSRWNVTAGSYLAARISRSTLDADAQRQVLLGTTLTPLAGSRRDTITLASLEVGHSVSLGPGSLTPYLTLSGLRLEQARFSESGAGGLGLSAPAQGHRVLLATAGVRYGQGFAWAGGHSWLSGYAFYQRVLSGAELGFHAAFAGVPDAPFVAHGQNLARHAAFGGADLATQVNPSWGWYLDASFEHARSHLASKSLTAGVRVSF